MIGSDISLRAIGSQELHAGYRPIDSARLATFPTSLLAGSSGAIVMKGRIDPEYVVKIQHA